MTYRVDVERDEAGVWVAQVPDVPGCHSQGRSLAQVRRRIREALGLWVDDSETAELDFRYHWGERIPGVLRLVRESRLAAENAHRIAMERLRAAANALVRIEGLSMRDTGELLGVSHQRVQQLLQGPPALSPLNLLLAQAGRELQGSWVFDEPTEPLSAVGGEYAFHDFTFWVTRLARESGASAGKSERIAAEAGERFGGGETGRALLELLQFIRERTSV